MISEKQNLKSIATTNAFRMNTCIVLTNLDLSMFLVLACYFFTVANNWFLVRGFTKSKRYLNVDMSSSKLSNSMSEHIDKSEIPRGAMRFLICSAYSIIGLCANKNVITLIDWHNNCRYYLPDRVNYYLSSIAAFQRNLFFLPQLTIFDAQLEYEYLIWGDRL